MSKKSLYLLGIVLTILIGTWLYWKYCCSCQCNGKNKFAITGDYEAECPDGINYLPSSITSYASWNECINTSFNGLKEYLTANEERELNITSGYHSGEENGSMYPNLGIARSTVVKNALVEMGFSSSRINCLGTLDTSAMSDTLFGYTEFSVSSPEGEGTDWAKVGEDLKANPLVLYFQTGQQSINLTDEERQKIMRISQYLDHVEGSACITVGHTDAQGDRSANIELGQGRADFAKTYLVQNGISESKILASSQGPDNPIATNDTEEGRSKNRRTEITIN